MERVEDTAWRLKPRELPVDIIVAPVEWLETPLAKRMLRNRVILYDPLGVSEKLDTRN